MFSPHNQAICKQIIDTNFLDELYNALKLEYFEQFNGGMTSEQLCELRDKLVVLNQMLNRIREEGLKK
jgi:hypothetical protein